MKAVVVDILKEMDSISLDSMKEVQLMDRLDSKFVADSSLLPQLLRKMISYFRVQDIDGVRIAAYSTQYLDTPEISMYEMHHNRKLNRQKVRIRSYLDSNLSFLEVKNKSNIGRTAKLRVPTQLTHIEQIEELNEGVVFLSENTDVDVEKLLPSLANEFKRITFVNNELTERITIDTDLRFTNHMTGKEIVLDGVMIIELKQEGNVSSYFRDILTEMRIKKTKISKYCIGTVLTNPDCKYNRFKKKSRDINKLINQNTNDSN